MRGNACVTGRPCPELLEHAPHHRLDGLEDVLLRREAHLHVELVELAGRAVGARVLVAEAGRDLEVAVETRHHDQLLELLRRLRQRVELARMQAARHEEVARALGRGGGQDRRLELGEALRFHAVAQASYHAGAQHDVVVQALAAQIEEAVLQPGLLGIIHLAEHRQRQLLGGPEHLHVADEHLDLAGRDLRVHQRRIARLHLAIDADHPFRAHLLDLREGRAVAIRQHLGDAVMVAQVDEEHAAMVAHPVNPARKPHGLPTSAAVRSAQVWLR